MPETSPTNEPTGRKLHGPTYLELQTENARLTAKVLGWQNMYNEERTAAVRDRELRQVAEGRVGSTLAQLAAAREETAEYAARVNQLRKGLERCEAESTDLHRQDGYKSCFFCGVNGRNKLYHNAGCPFEALTLIPPNGESAMKRAEHLEEKLQEIKSWAEPYLWLADGFGPYSYEEVSSKWAEDVHTFVDGLRERLPLSTIEPMNTIFQQRDGALTRAAKLEAAVQRFPCVGSGSNCLTFTNGVHCTCYYGRAVRPCHLCEKERAALAERPAPHVHEWVDVANGKDARWCFGCQQNEAEAAR